MDVSQTSENYDSSASNTVEDRSIADDFNNISFEGVDPGAFSADFNETGGAKKKTLKKLTPEEKKARNREMNNNASRIYRENKKKKEETAKTKAEEIEIKNKELQKLFQKLSFIKTKQLQLFNGLLTVDELKDRDRLSINKVLMNISPSEKD